MRSERTKQTLKLQLLALVLALALVWYSLNPVPRPITGINREDESPDEKRREVGPQLRRAAILPIVFGTLRPASGDKSIPDHDEDDFDWPDLIDG